MFLNLPCVSQAGSNDPTAVHSHQHPSTHQGSERGLVQRRVTLHRHFNLSCQVQARREDLEVESCDDVGPRSTACTTCTTRNCNLLLCLFSVCFHCSLSQTSAELQSETSSESTKMNSCPACGQHISVVLFYRLQSSSESTNRPARSYQRTLAAF